MASHSQILKLKMLYDSAVRANLEDPYRTGQLIELPAEGDIVVTGDLHGNEDNYEAIMERAALDQYPNRHLVIQEVTHVLKLGPDTSSVVIEACAKLKCKYPDRVHFLMGNHEHAELTGQEVMKGGVCLNIVFRNSLINKYGEGAETIRECIYDFFRSMPLGIKTPNGVFMSHSTPPTKLIKHYSLAFFRQSTEELWGEKMRKLLYLLLWSRDYDQNTADTFAAGVESKILLVGHKPCPQGFMVPNDTHIIIDCKDPRAHLISFRLDREYTHAELVDRIERLHPLPAEEVAQSAAVEGQPPA